MSFHILTVGNPNSGKTTLFNSLTGAKQQVGNWAGVTVEKKQGRYEFDNRPYHLTDLPGIYALDSGNDENSLDESIASKAVVNIQADLIINVIDSTALERSLYMTLQLRELGRPMVVILNKSDILAREGQVIDTKALSETLGCPVFMLSANNQKEVRELKKHLAEVLDAKLALEPIKVTYPAAVESAITKLTPLFENQDALISKRALAIRSLEQDALILEGFDAAQKANFSKVYQDLNSALDIDLNLTSTKYDHIHQICETCRQNDKSFTQNMTQKIDKLLLNKYLGIPFFFFVMYLMFMFSINIGSAFIDFFDIGVGALLVDGGHYLLDGVLPVWLVTVLADGLGGGIQTVATFIPVIACLYLFLSLLESSGYMARAAFVLDKVMQKIGLPGKAFVPLVLGFGCNVPAIMATRTLDQERERKLSAAMAPFMSCGARLPVYALFAAAFFPESGQNVVFGLYLLGILAAVFTGILLKKTLYPGVSSSFIMEMPNYEMPRLKNVGIKTWQKLKRFVFGAGKTIVVVVMVLSFLNSLGTDGSFGNEDSDKSVLSKASQIVTPVFAPMGIEEDNWPATVGIITGIFAKEAVVGTLNSLYSTPTDEDAEFDLGASLTEAVQSIGDNFAGLSYSDPLGVEVGDLTDTEATAEDQGVDTSIFGNLQSYFSGSHAAFAYLVFILLYTPCVAAMGAYVREFGSKFARFIAVYTMFLAYTSAVFIYQAVNFTQTPLTSGIYLAIVIALYVGMYMLFKRYGSKKQAMRIDVVNVS